MAMVALLQHQYVSTITSVHSEQVGRISSTNTHACTQLCNYASCVTHTHETHTVNFSRLVSLYKARISLELIFSTFGAAIGCPMLAGMIVCACSKKLY